MLNPFQRTACVLLIVAPIASSFAPLAHAALVVTGEQVQTAVPGAVVQRIVPFFIDLTGPDDGGTFDVGNFQVRLQLTGPSAGVNVSAVLVENNMSLINPQVVPLDVTNVDSTTQVFAATLGVTPITLNDGGGLLQVVLNVTPTVSVGDVYTLEVVTGAGNTEFIDPNDFTTLLPFSFSNGTLAVIPEPSAGLYVGSLAVAAVIARSHRRRQRGSATANA